MSSTKVKVVMFDQIGVVGDLEGMDEIIAALKRIGGEGTLKKFGEIMKKLEIGELTLTQCREHMNDLKEDLIQQGQAKETVEEEMKKINSDAVMKHLQRDETVLAAIQTLRKNGFKAMLLTNNFWTDEGKTKSLMIENSEDCFDVIVESCRVGLTKPDKKMFELALAKVGHPAEECIFLDDFPHNCIGAKAAGIQAIEVDHKAKHKALEELQKILGCTLIN
ncbi:hypothetical protein L596_014641 [Steinernema carpocapsae]|uniref:Uncharacterized protein n=1 Tax=Steinernema carpocapsae TaxID=34508 RepID=A0A4U5NCP7_STECR|nr:hypothetical protein L596_014641 [Steinernema carpocapsae]